MNIPAPVIETVPIGKLRPWDKNPRKNHAVDAIARSIESFGYLAPIIVQKGTYRILAGHGRLEALVKKQATEIPVLVADVTDEQADLYTIADNKLTELAEWDFPQLAELLRTLDGQLAGFTAAELAAIEKSLVPSDNEVIDELKLAETLHECPKCGFKW
jgi:ParB family chromosome partitioning protein